MSDRVKFGLKIIVFFCHLVCYAIMSHLGYWLQLNSRLITWVESSISFSKSIKMNDKFVPSSTLVYEP